MRVAITGATGFVGKAVLHHMRDSGHELSMLVRNPAQQKLPLHARIIQGNLHNPSALDELCSDADVVVHIAGAIAAVDRAAFANANTTGTRNLVRAANGAHVRRFIYISSLAARQPQLSDYAASKAGGEQEVQAVHGEKLILRPSAVYGPGDEATRPLLQQLMQRVAVIPGRPSQTFSMIHVQDLATIIAEAVTSPITGARELDDTAGQHTWVEVVEITRQAFQRPQRTLFLPRPAAMAVASLAENVAKFRSHPSMISVGKMRELYHADWTVQGDGWPRANPVHLREGLVETIKWYFENGHIRRFT